jgi:aspartate ammonia-lyase
MLCVVVSAVVAATASDAGTSKNMNGIYSIANPNTAGGGDWSGDYAQLYPNAE